MYDTLQTPQGIHKDPGTGAKAAKTKHKRYYSNRILIPEELGFDPKKYYDDSIVVDIHIGSNLLSFPKRLESMTD